MVIRNDEKLNAWKYGDIFNGKRERWVGALEIWQLNFA